ncbi:SMC family ATPase [Nocardioides sp.]|uniref:SMC family ATPase n=1 Tax=Nocardioides sp. TaxID=35761 RepID=UPI002BF811AC|nr:SMC family ATPase [Nocardioides sp.]HXH78892.1 SMC family ATPase [Nocardioides sp.]
MRLHSLQITAFGPFADTCEVDFDALSDSGLFLLSGPTGAGKSSILDAVCFALYGDVPGDRGTAGRLRCDQAPEGVAPRVRLEVTLSGRRFRVERSPKWERPKKRGTGVTTQQASVVISERVAQTWQPLSTRLDETGHLVTGLVGLNLTQFTQVAMLPQGRFQAFLRARSEERHALLRQVFRTGRFDRIEQWLRERRLELQRTSAAHGRDVAQLVSRLSETADQPLPTDWSVADLSLEASDDAVTGWVEKLLTAAEQDVVATAAARAQADESVDRSSAALADGRSLADRQAAHAAAAAVLAEHDDDALAQLRSRSRRADRAEPLRELEATVEEDAARLAELGRKAAAVTAAWSEVAGDHPSAPQSDDLPRLLDATGRRLEVANAARPDAERLVEVSRSCEETSAHLTRARADASRASGERQTAPARLRTAEAELAEADAAQHRLPASLASLAAARQRAEAAVALTEVTSALEQTHLDREAARELVADLKETWLAIREARLDGMAAEIAGAIAVGACCPVCGSHEHPALAVSTAGTPDGADERAARKVLDDAEAVLVVLDDQLRESQSRHTRLLTLADGQSAAEATQALADLQRSHDQDAAAAAQCVDLRTAVTRMRLADDELRSTHELLIQRCADLESRLELHRAERQRLRDRMDEVLAGTGCATVAELVRLRTRQHDAAARLCAAKELVTMAERDLAKAQRALAAAAMGAGFESAAEARSARLAKVERETLAARLAAIDEAQRSARSVLDDPEQQAAAALPRPDVDGLADEHAAAEVRARSTHARHDEAARRHTRLCTLGDQTAAELARWSPVRDELELTARLAHFAEGKSPDNALQMRLSAYVLAHRLTQVVAAANERLAGMSDQRYSLEHTGKRGAGETRGGLSLLVRDDWSGEARDPATLSGGETFVVSLALALGLADVITQEAGGADLDTLFVDEGFGSLDADTLDDVMDTLDGLRDGGRIVGVVSHVAEMQTRIPGQLRVTKGRGGSHLSVRVG